MGRQKPKAEDVHLSELEIPHAFAKKPWARAWLVVGRHRLTVPGPLINRVTEIAKTSGRRLADVLSDVLQDGLRARGDWPRPEDVAMVERAIAARRDERIEQAKADQERQERDERMARRLHLNTYKRAVKHYAAHPGVLSAPAFRKLVGLAEAAAVPYRQILADLGRDPRNPNVAGRLRRFIGAAPGTPAAAAFATLLEPEPLAGFATADSGEPDSAAQGDAGG